MLLCLGLVLAASFALKWSIAEELGPLMPRGDEGQYLRASRSLFLGGDQGDIEYRFPRWDELHFPPLYPRFVSLQPGQLPTRRLQVAVSTAAVLCVFLLGLSTVGPRAALFAATATAFHPTLVAYTHYMLSETLFTALLVAALALLVGREARPRGWPALLAAGVLVGLAGLTRVTAVYLTPFLLAWVVYSERSLRRALPRVSALAAGVVLAVAPTIVDIYREHGGFLLISSGSGQAWYRGYNVFPPENHDLGFGPDRRSMAQVHHAETKRPPVVHPNPVSYAREETRRGIEYARENPHRALERFVLRVAELVNPSSLLARRLRTDGYVPRGGGEPLKLSPAATEGVIALDVASSMALILLAVVGFGVLPGGRARTLLLTAVLFLVAFSCLTFSGSRYRVPITPLLALVAGAVATSPRAALAALTRPSRAAPTAIALALLVWAWVLHVGKTFA